MSTLQHIDVGSRVVIRREWAGCGRPATFGAVGEITGTARANLAGQEVDCFLVKRDDRAKGAGEGGAWICPPGMLEPYELGLGTDVRCLGAQAVVDDPAGVVRAVHGFRYAENGNARYQLSGLAYEPHRYELECVRSGDVPRELEQSPPTTPVPAVNDGARVPSILPNDSTERKKYPLAAVLFGQFPAACIAVAHHSFKGNQKHNPGKELQDNRTLSNDDADCILRHQLEGDYEGVAWRAMRQLQKHLESEGAPVAPLARFE